MSLSTSTSSHFLTPKRFSFGVVLLTVVAVTVGFSLSLLVDPFNVWHPTSPDRYNTSDPRIAKRAIVRDVRYDSFVLGTSLSQKLDVSALNAELGAEFGDLTMGGATSYEIRNILQSLPQLSYRYLILEVYFASYLGEGTDTRYDDYPEYLWDDNRTNDVLLYFDLLLRRQLPDETLNAIKVNLLGHTQQGTGLYDEIVESNGVMRHLKARTWNEDDRTTATEKVYDLTDRADMTFHKSNLPEMLEIGSEKFDQVIVYLPPISAVSLKQQLSTVDPLNIFRYEKWVQWLTDLIREHQNISVINYQTINDITTSQINYWDFNHYRDNVSRMIVEDFVEIFRSGRPQHDNFGVFDSASTGLTSEDLILFNEASFFGN